MLLRCLLFIGLLLQGRPAGAQGERFVDSVASVIGTIDQEIVELSPELFMIRPYGLAGNTGVLVSNEGVLLIDDQWAVLADRIEELVGSISDQPIKYIINTHYHFDHTNGNLAFGPKNIPIVAHNKAANRMTEVQVLPTYFDVVQHPYPAAARPSLGFDRRMTLTLGNQSVELIHFPNAHTDGDLIVHIPALNTYHTGDIFQNTWLPHIDEMAGGDIYGIIEALDYLLAHSDAQTQFIPGHGPVADRLALNAYRDLNTSLLGVVQSAYLRGLDPSEIVKEVKDKLAYEHFSGDDFIHQVYRSVVRHFSE